MSWELLDAHMFVNFFWQYYNSPIASRHGLRPPIASRGLCPGSYLGRALSEQFIREGFVWAVPSRGCCPSSSLGRTLSRQLPQEGFFARAVPWGGFCEVVSSRGLCLVSFLERICLCSSLRKLCPDTSPEKDFVRTIVFLHVLETNGFSKNTVTNGYLSFILLLLLEKGVSPLSLSLSLSLAHC